MKLYPTSVALSLTRAVTTASQTVICMMSDEFNRRRGILEGDVIIRGWRRPCASVPNTSRIIMEMLRRNWVEALSKLPGVKRVKGRVAASESIYDFDPAPAGWSWGDLGNYYGAGVYDINFNDNTVQHICHRSRSEGTACVQLIQWKSTGKGYSPDELPDIIRQE
ncbi:MAG: hypothetical protein MZV63_02770 [Marinilabiliales bacterium]|nr:hypothetical protein [Marinilabiliales bacterium]